MQQPDAAGFVLAGGRSSRMGRDKALVELAGQPLIAHALRILREANLPASIAGGQPALAAFAPLIEDTRRDQGPLSGICAALASTKAEWAVFLPIDLPLLPASLLEYLLRHARITGNPVTIPSINGFPQTFPAVLHRSALPTLERELNAGRSGCFSAFQAACTNVVILSDRSEAKEAEGAASAFRSLPTQNPVILSEAPFSGAEGPASASRPSPPTNPVILSEAPFSGAEGPAFGISILPVEALVQCAQLAHPQALPPSRWFLNVNTPQNLLRAQAHHRNLIA
jgi:molybdenum cofactor guanylyltransferase